MAASAYGWAKFPALADDAKRTALANQLDQYVRAAPGFSVGFERRWVAGGARAGMRVLAFGPPRRP